MEDALALQADPAKLYNVANADTRRLANQTFFKRIEVCEREGGADSGDSVARIRDDPPCDGLNHTRTLRIQLEPPYTYFRDPETQGEASAFALATGPSKRRKGRRPVQTGAGLILDTQGSFHRVLRNLNPRVGELRKRLSGSDAGWQGDAANWRLQDVRGELAGRTGKAQTPVTPGVSACLAEEYEAGASAAALASKHNMHKSTVWRHLARAGVKTGRHFMANNERLVAEVRVLREHGLSLRHIAVATGISHPSVLRLLDSASDKLSYPARRMDAIQKGRRTKWSREYKSSQRCWLGPPTVPA